MVDKKIIYKVIDCKHKELEKTISSHVKKLNFAKLLYKTLINFICKVMMNL